VSINGVVVAEGPVDKFARHLVANQKMPRTKAEAEILEAAVELWHRKGCPPLESEHVAPVVEDRKFSTAFAEYRKRHLSTLAEGGDRVRPFEERWKSKPLSVILDVSELEDYRDDRLDDDDVETNAAFNRDYACLSHFTNWCMGRTPAYLVGKRPFFHRTFNPTGIKKLPEGNGRFRRLELPDAKRENEHERAGDEARLIKSIERLPENGEEMRGRFFCAVDAGLRKGEMLALQRDDVLWKHRDGVMLRVQWQTSKTKKERLVPVVTERLEEYLDGRRFARFPFGDAEGAQIGTFSKSWTWVRTDARVENLTWHDLRHECGSRFAEGRDGRPGVALHELMILMGHSNIATTQRYLNPRLSSLAENMRKAVGR